MTEKTAARGRHAKSAPADTEGDELVTPDDEDVEPETCNVCWREPEPNFRGLCAGHWASMRGMANPKEPR